METNDIADLAIRDASLLTERPDSAVEAQMTIQGAIVMAKHFPRNEDAARVGILKDCRRPSFVLGPDDKLRAMYRFPRGGTPISGLGVIFAREAARRWGNMRYGLDIVKEKEDERTIRGWAWDLENNVYEYLEETFKKLIQRKKKVWVNNKPEDQTIWIEPDERDLAEMTRSRGAKLVRNCILHLLPDDLKEEAKDLIWKTLEDDTAEDPDKVKKAILATFAGYNVPVEELDEYLGHPVGQATPAELTMLRGVIGAMRERERPWFELLAERRAERGAEIPSVKADASALLAGARPAPFEPPQRKDSSTSAPAAFLPPEAVNALLNKAKGLGLTPDDFYSIIDEKIGKGTELTAIPALEDVALSNAIDEYAKRRKTQK